MSHLEAEWPSKQNILIAYTILAESGPWPGLKVWGKNTFLGGKDFYRMFETNFLSTTELGGIKIGLGVSAPNVPHVFGCGKNRHQKVFHWGPSCLCRGARHSENVYLMHNMNSICTLCK